MTNMAPNRQEKKESERERERVSERNTENTKNLKYHQQCWLAFTF